MFIFKFNGNKHSPYEKHISLLDQGILTRDGYKVDMSMDTPPGPYTKVDSLDFDTAMEKSVENTKRILEERAKKEEAERALQEERYQTAMEEAMASGKGWYSVNLRVLVMKHSGNDGWVDQSVRVLAENGYDAYERASEFVQDPFNYQSNILSVLMVSDFVNTHIEYIGLLTDAYLEGLE